MFAGEMVEDEVPRRCGGHSTEAIHVLDNRFDIRIVMTDIDTLDRIEDVMHAACIRGRWLPIDILTASGKPFSTEARLPQRALFLPKPYRQCELITAMRDISAVSAGRPCPRGHALMPGRAES